MTIPVKGDFPWLPRPHWTPKLSSSPRKSPWLGSWVPAARVRRREVPGPRPGLGAPGSAVEVSSTNCTWCRAPARPPSVGGALPSSHGLAGHRWESPAASSSYLTRADSDPHPWPEGAAATPPGPLMGNRAARAWLGPTLTHGTPPNLCHWESHLPLAKDAPASLPGSVPLHAFAPAVPWLAVTFYGEPSVPLSPAQRPSSGGERQRFLWPGKRRGRGRGGNDSSNNNNDSYTVIRVTSHACAVPGTVGNTSLY